MAEQPMSERKRYRLLDDGRRGLLRAWLVVLLVTVAAFLYPVRDQMTRGILLAGPALLWLAWIMHECSGGMGLRARPVRLMNRSG